MTPPDKDVAKTISLEEALEQRELVRTKLETKLIESLLQDDFGGSDLFYDIQRQKYGSGEWVSVPISVVSDRKDGANWPLFRNEQELAQYRQRSRVICQKNSYAISLLGNLANYCIGQGFTYRVEPKKARDESPAPGVQVDNTDQQIADAGQAVLDKFLISNRWTATVNPDPSQSLIASAREREGHTRLYRDGETIIRFFFDEDAGETAVRFVEPEQIGDPPEKQAGDGWSFGMQHRTEPFEDEETIEEIYVKYKSMDGKSKTGEHVPAEEFVHIKLPGQDAAVKRGLPFFILDTADAFERAAKLQRNASITSSVKAATAEYWQHANSSEAQVGSLAQRLGERTSTNPISGKTETQERFRPGGVRRVSAGMQMILPNSGGISEYLEVAQGDLRQGASAANAPEYMTGDASNANYSSTKEAGTPFVLASESVQGHFKTAYSVVALRALRHAVQCNKLPPNFFEVCELHVETPAISVRDPLQKAQEDGILIDKKVKSPQTCQAERSLDPDHEAANFEEFEQRFGGMGNPLAAMMNGGGQDPNAAPRLPGGGLESIEELLENFSGTITDSAGRKITYANGKRVANPGTDPDHGSSKDKAESWASYASKIPSKIYAVAKSKAQAKFGQLKERYGHKMAVAIMAAGVAGLPLPIPGSSFITAAPVVAVAELVRYFHKQPAAVAESQEPELDQAEIEKLGKAFIDELLAGHFRDLHTATE